jgi:hypothetical protein
MVSQQLRFKRGVIIKKVLNIYGTWPNGSYQSSLLIQLSQWQCLILFLRSSMLAFRQIMRTNLFQTAFFDQPSI